jgi:lipid-binding SYLF domain-containing protein
MKTVTALALVCTVIVTSLGCLGPRGSDVEAKRQYVRNMRDESRRKFEAANPNIIAKTRRAYGYAVFSNLSTKFFLLSPGQGYGMAVVNGTGKETFMRMAQLGVGPGIGIVNQTVLFIFPKQAAFDQFVTYGVQIGASGEAVATSEDYGGGGVEAGAKATTGGAGGSGMGQLGAKGETGGLGAGVEVYQLTKNGLALQAVINGTKYWKDGALN